MEILTLLSQAKEAGFDVPNMLCLVGIYFALKRDTKKNIETLKIALTGHEEKSQKRFKRIEDKIGLEEWKI